jgi:hypothetical protein
VAYPTDIDTFPDPTPTAPKTSPSHSGLHNSINTAVEALETEVGTTIPASGSLRERVALLEAGGFGNAQPAIIVASVDAPQVIKDAADYECDGTADQVEINAALVDAAVLASRGGPSGAEQRGSVVLSGGQFTINGSILMRTGTWLQGCGYLTEIRASSLSAVTGAGPDAAMIKFADVNVHLTKVSNFWLHGNFGSGGACHGINYYALAGSRSGYPDSNPDPDNMVCDLYIHGFTTGTRHGIYMNEDLRGTFLDRLHIRQCSGHGIFFLNSPDSHISNCHVGTITLSGYRINGGNCKLTNSKAYFCDVSGFAIVNARTIVGDCESQDNAVGFDFAQSQIVASNLLVDTSSADGIIVNGNQISLNGFVILVRTGGRYGTQTNGIRFVGTPTDTHATGVVVPTNITNKVSGTFTGARNFIRISDGTALRATTDAVGGGGAFAAVVANLDTAAVGTGKKRFYNDSGRILLIQSTRLTVGTAPAGQAIIGDIHKNEVTIFTTQSKRPQIAIGAFTDQGDLPDVTQWNPGEYLTFDLDQVGTTEPGRDLTFAVWVT